MDILALLAILGDIGVIVLAIIGGLWGFYKFRKMRVGEGKLEIELIPVVYHTIKSKIIEVTIRLKNSGSAAIYSKVPCNPQCTLEVKAIQNVSKNSAIPWDDNNLLSLFEPIEYLKELESWYPELPYLLEPGTIETMQVIFSTSHDGLICIKVSYVDKDDNMWTAKKIIDLRVETSCNNG